MLLNSYSSSLSSQRRKTETFIIDWNCDNEYYYTTHNGFVIKVNIYSAILKFMLHFLPF
mgnify:CR=1 FL=1